MELIGNIYVVCFVEGWVVLGLDSVSEQTVDYRAERCERCGSCTVSGSFAALRMTARTDNDKDRSRSPSGMTTKKQRQQQ